MNLLDLDADFDVADYEKPAAGEKRLLNKESCCGCPFKLEVTLLGISGFKPYGKSAARSKSSTCVVPSRIRKLDWCQE
jgi:hypothetical protein